MNQWWSWLFDSTTEIGYSDADDAGLHGVGKAERINKMRSLTQYHFSILLHAEEVSLEMLYFELRRC